MTCTAGPGTPFPIRRPVRNITPTELLGVVHDHVPAGTVRFGTTVTAVESGQAVASAVTAMGERVTAELVVGADGTASVVRRSVVAAAPARPSGWMTVQALLDGPQPTAVAQGFGLSFVGPAGFFALMPAGARMQWWCDVRVPPEGWRSVDVPWLRQNFRGYVPLVGEMFDRVDALTTSRTGRTPCSTSGGGDRRPCWATPPMRYRRRPGRERTRPSRTHRHCVRSCGWRTSRPGPRAATNATASHACAGCRGWQPLSGRTRVPGPVAGRLMRVLPGRLAGAALEQRLRSWSSVLSGSRP